MKTTWCFSTVQIFMLYITTLASGVILGYIIQGLREGQASFQEPLWLLALASLLLSLSLIWRARSK